MIIIIPTIIIIIDFVGFSKHIIISSPNRLFYIFITNYFASLIDFSYQMTLVNNFHALWNIGESRLTCLLISVKEKFLEFSH